MSHGYRKINELSGLNPVYPVLMLYIFWSRRTCCRRKTSFMSAPSPSAWLWTTVLVLFQWLRHACCVQSAGGSSGVTWSYSVPLRVFHCWPSLLLVKYRTRRQVLPGTSLCIKLLLHFLKATEALNQKRRIDVWEWPTRFPIMQTIPRHILHHLLISFLSYSLYAQARTSWLIFEYLFDVWDWAC